MVLLFIRVEGKFLLPLQLSRIVSFFLLCLLLSHVEESLSFKVCNSHHVPSTTDPHSGTVVLGTTDPHSGKCPDLPSTYTLSHGQLSQVRVVVVVWLIFAIFVSSMVVQKVDRGNCRTRQKKKSNRLKYFSGVFQHELESTFYTIEEPTCAWDLYSTGLTISKYFCVKRLIIISQYKFKMKYLKSKMLYQYVII